MNKPLLMPADFTREKWKDSFSCQTDTGRFLCPAHYHHTIEIIYVRSGRLEVMFKNDYVMLYAPSLLVIPPDVVHGISNVAKLDDGIVLGFTSDIIASTERSQDSFKFLVPFSHRDIGQNCIFADTDGEYGALMSRFAAVYSAAVPGYELSANAVILEIYAKLYAEWSRRGLAGDYSATNRRVIDYVVGLIGSSYAEELSPYRAAAELNMSYSNFCRVVKDNFGVTFMGLLCAARISAAEKLLCTTDMPVSEIALATGYADVSYFIRRFRRTAGCAPTEYRRKMAALLK